MKKLLVPLFFGVLAILGDAPNAFEPVYSSKQAATPLCSAFDGSVSGCDTKDEVEHEESWRWRSSTRYVNPLKIKKIPGWLKGLCGLCFVGALIKATLFDEYIVDCQGMWDSVIGYYRRYQFSKLPSSLKDNIYGNIYNRHFIPEE